ncbi:MAG: radical SAM protein [Vulcanimicrobiota bacterium]
MLRLSAGTARVLGFNKIQMETPPTCGYIMLGQGCQGKCAFCAQSSLAENSEFLSRITWKPGNEQEFLERLVLSYNKNELGRVCLQVIQKEDSFTITRRLLKKIRKKCPIPICVSINGIDLKQMKELVDMGADKIAISFDAATPLLFEKIKQKKWDDYWNLYVQACKEIREHIVIHLILGLGETALQAFNALKAFYENRTPVSLFAFTPLKGTPLSGRKPPELQYYRKLQIAHYFIRENALNQKDYPLKEILALEDNRLAFKVEKEYLLQNIPGSAFQTFGCSSCNRPFYNEKPGQLPYNYPRRLMEHERIKAIEQAMGEF